MHVLCGDECESVCHVYIVGMSIVLLELTFLQNLQECLGDYSFSHFEAVRE